MGIDAGIESETGEAIEELCDLTSLVNELLSDFNDKDSVCLRFVDPKLKVPKGLILHQLDNWLNNNPSDTFFNLLKQRI